MRFHFVFVVVVVRLDVNVDGSQHWFPGSANVVRSDGCSPLHASPDAVILAVVTALLSHCSTVRFRKRVRDRFVVRVAQVFFFHFFFANDGCVRLSKCHAFCHEFSHAAHVHWCVMLGVFA